MKNITKKYIYFISALLLILLSFKFINNVINNDNKIKKDQHLKEEILSEETLKELDSLNKSIDSLSVKNDIKVGRVIETKIK